MKGNELLEKLSVVDGAYIQEAERAPARPRGSLYIAAACLCLLALAAVLLVGSHGRNVPLSEQSTASVRYGADQAAMSGGSQAQLLWLSEEELFSPAGLYAFRGVVTALQNLTLDFGVADGAACLDYRCVAEIRVDTVYQGPLTPGQTIRVLLPCAVGEDGFLYEDCDRISRIQVGMEGIFMPIAYTENSYREENGKRLRLLDLAPCGLWDGSRYVFLQTERGLDWAHHAYTSAGTLTNLEQAEDYVRQMLARYGQG